MFSLWSKIKTNVIAFLAFLLPIVAILSYVFGRKGGGDAVRNDINEEIMEDVYIAKRARQDVEGLSDDDLTDRASRWVRKGSDK